MAFSLSMNEVLKDAQRINEFRGDDTFALTSFLREVETIFDLVETVPDAKAYIFKRVILNKVQGEALHVLRTLGLNPTWEELKATLISNFGVKETYHQLYQEAFAQKNNGIVSYFKSLSNILCKINEKYEYDTEKPLEFSPAYAEKIILKTFINNIDVNLASVIINRNITKLRDAFNILEREGLIRSNIETNKFTANMRKENHRTNLGNDRNKVQFNDNRNIQYSSNRQNSNTYQNRNNNSNNNSSNIRSSDNNRNFQHNRGSNQYQNSGRFGQNSSQMEIDHIQEVEDYCDDEQVNFHTTASSRHFR